MILLVDVGNTRVKWRLYSGNKAGVKPQGSVFNAEFTVAYLERSLSAFKLEAIYLSCVGQDSTVDVLKVYANLRMISLHEVFAQKVMGRIRFVYEDVARLGVDRCLAMVGAYEGCGVLVIDAGSAITADIVTEKGEHCGGFILPGYEMSRAALLGKTAKIGVLASQGEPVLGTDTVSCVNNGFALQYRSLLCGLVELASSMGVTRYVITGGDGEAFASLCSDKVEFYDNLVLDGLEKCSMLDSCATRVCL